MRIYPRCLSKATLGSYGVLSSRWDSGDIGSASARMGSGDQPRKQPSRSRSFKPPKIGMDNRYTNTCPEARSAVSFKQWGGVNRRKMAESWKAEVGMSILKWVAIVGDFHPWYNNFFAADWGVFRRIQSYKNFRSIIQNCSLSVIEILNGWKTG